jgi:hypothetical protein
MDIRLSIEFKFRYDGSVSHEYMHVKYHIGMWHKTKYEMFGPYIICMFSHIICLVEKHSYTEEFKFWSQISLA